MRRSHYIVLILLLISQISFGQVYQNMAQPGYKFARGRFDSVLTIPSGLGSLKNISGGRDTGQIRFNVSDSSVYVWNGMAWIKPVGGGGGSTDTTSLSNRINLKLNISDTATMLSPYSRVSVTSYGKNVGGDSTILVLSNGTRYAAKDSVGGGGGSQTLQQTVAIGNTATNAFYSLDSIKAANLVTSGGAIFGDSTILTTDSIYLYGASIELGTGATGSSNFWVNRVASNLGATIVNRAIGGTSFSSSSVGDSSFMDRLAGLPINRSTRRYIVIGASNILNDMQFHRGIANLQANLSKAIDTLNLNRGWPLSKIIISMPGAIGTASASITNDSLGFYVRAAISTVISKGVKYVDNYTYTNTYGGAANVSSDSIHPNNTGHYLLSEGFTYRISDVKISNSIRVNRDFLAKGNASIGGKLTMSVPATRVQNLSGQLSWGDNGGLNGNGIILYDAGSTSLRSGIGFTNSAAEMMLFARSGGGGGDMLFGTGLDASNLTTSNANFYLATGTPSANGKATTFNGLVKFSSITPTIYAANSTAGNITGRLNWGSTGSSQQGIYTLDAGTTALRGGLIYDSQFTGNSFLFGRGSLPFMFGIGLDNTNMTTANASFYINTSNRLVVNNSMAIGGTTPAASALLDLTSTTKGFLRPLQTTTERNAIASPATGLSVYNTTLSTNDVKTAAAWYQQPNGLTGSGTLDFPSTGAHSSEDLTITVTGAADGDMVILGVPNASVTNDSNYSAWVSAANTVTVRYNHYGSGTSNPASGTFKVYVIKN